MIPPQSWAGSVGAGIGPGASWPLALAAALSSGPPGGGDPHAHMGAAARGGHLKPPFSNLVQQSYLVTKGVNTILPVGAVLQAAWAAAEAAWITASPAAVTEPLPTHGS